MLGLKVARARARLLHDNKLLQSQLANCTLVSNINSSVITGYKYRALSVIVSSFFLAIQSFVKNDVKKERIKKINETKDKAIRV